MRAGVLIVGSLFWDDLDVRRRWREERLDLDQTSHVAAPIRYGRVSSKRGNTYTMVFSAECVRGKGGNGIGLAVPFRRPIESRDDLLEEAARLWAAEAEKERLSPGVYSARWGSVGLLPNPDSAGVRLLLPAWAEAVSTSPHYGDLHSADGEPPSLSPATGVAQIPWPRVATEGSTLSFDLLLLTATDPTMDGGKYASPAVVAEAWRAMPEHMEYFEQNRKHGIGTAEDQDIAGELVS